MHICLSCSSFLSPPFFSFPFSAEESQNDDKRVRGIRKFGKLTINSVLGECLTRKEREPVKRDFVASFSIQVNKKYIKRIIIRTTFINYHKLFTFQVFNRKYNFVNQITKTKLD